MVFFTVGSKIFCFFAVLDKGTFQGGSHVLQNFEEGCSKIGGRGSDRFKFFLGGDLDKNGGGQYFMVGLINWRTLWWIFRKWFMKISRKKIFIPQQVYLYIQVTDILSFMESYFVHIVKVCSAFKKHSFSLYSSVYA